MKKVKVDSKGNQFFFDGHKWELMESPADQLRSDAVDGQIKAQRKSKKVIIENISADLGLSANELKNWFMEQLQDRFISAVTIENVDVLSLAPTNAVQVELGDFDMLE